MNEDPRFEKLLRTWEDLRRRGQPASAEELARDHPELLPKLKEQIAAIEGLGRFLQVRANRAEETEGAAANDLRDTLRRRLIVITLVALGYAAADWIYTYWGRPSGEPAAPILEYVVPCLGLAGLLGLLLAPFTLTLGVLRGIELTLFGMVTAALAYGEYQWFGSRWVAETASGAAADKVSLLIADSSSVPWFVLIVLYGTCVPNEGRRCAAVVAAMSAAALIVPLLMSGPVDPATVARRTAFWLVLGAIIAVYGSHRLSSLRQQVYEARRMGQYVLKRFIGAGGMGEVFLAEHQLLRRLCAIKIIRPESGSDATSFQRFEREVKATASLTHGSIVEIYDFGRTDDGLFYYVMEYLPGMTLQEIIEKHGQLPPARVVHLLRQLCWGLREAHAVGLIHRDIKPGNILVCERGRLYDVAKLLDFGLVKAAESPRLSVKELPAPSDTPTSGELTQAGCVVGTPRYMAPEQISGDGVDARSDLYSLGLVAYYALAGRQPFHAETFREFATAHQFSLPPALVEVCPEVGRELSEVVMRCLAKKPSDRFADAESLEAALATCPCANTWTPADAAGWWEKHAPETPSLKG